MSGKTGAGSFAKIDVPDASAARNGVRRAVYAVPFTRVVTGPRAGSRVSDLGPRPGRGRASVRYQLPEQAVALVVSPLALRA